MLVTGDALITVDVLDHRRTGPQLIRPEFNHDDARAWASLAAFEALEADVLLPGHGEPFHGTPAEAVGRVRAVGR